VRHFFFEAGVVETKRNVGKFKEPRSGRRVQDQRGLTRMKSGWEEKLLRPLPDAVRESQLSDGRKLRRFRR
jgi:hypothetical protein